MVQSPTLIQTLKLLLSLVTDVICSSVPIFANKKQKRWSHSKEHAIYGPGLRFFFVLMYMRTVRSQTGTKVTRVGSATEMKSDRSEFIFRPIQCKHMKRNVWRPIRTHTGLSSSQSHARKYPLVLLVRESTFDLWFALFSSRKIDFKYRLLNFGFAFFAWPLSTAVDHRWPSEAKYTVTIAVKKIEIAVVVFLASGQYTLSMHT